MFTAEVRRALNLVRFNHKAFPYCCSEILQSFRDGCPLPRGSGFSVTRALVFTSSLVFHTSTPGSVFICLLNILLLPVCAVWCGQWGNRSYLSQSSLPHRGSNGQSPSSFQSISSLSESHTAQVSWLWQLWKRQKGISSQHWTQQGQRQM